MMKTNGVVPEIMKHSEAAALGLTKYFTGKRCKHGHLDYRYTNGGRCYECNRQITNAAYHRNPEKQKQWQRDNPEKAAEYARKWRGSNPEYAKNYRDELKKDPERYKKALANIAAWQRANPDRVRDIQRKCYRKKRLAAGYPEPKHYKTRNEVLAG